MADEIVKSKEVIKRFKSILQEELDGLPERSVFGDSNEESKAELRRWIRELEMALEGKLPEDKTGEVYWWLTGKNETFAKACGLEGD